MILTQAVGSAIALFFLSGFGVCLAGTAPGGGGRSSPPVAGPAGARTAQVFDVDSSGDGRRIQVYVDGQEVLRLTDGKNLRLRCDPRKDQWIGYDGAEIYLGWSPNDHHRAANVTAVEVEEDGERLRIVIAGEKPDFPGSRYRVSLAGEFDERGIIRYTLDSELRFGDAAGTGQMDSPAGPRVEFLDVFIGRIFWPEKYRGSRELYEEFVFGTPGGVVRAPKLHVFSGRAAGAPLPETLEQVIDDGSFLAVVDSLEGGYTFRVNDLAARGSVGICWWTWDPHFSVGWNDTARSFSYNLTIEMFDARRGRALLRQARAIPFWKDPDYQLPVFRLYGNNDFRKRVSKAEDWTWERTTDCARLDFETGYDDNVSATIGLEGDGRCAWYSRILWRDVWDQRPIYGKHRLSAMVRTRGVTGQVRLGALQANGPEVLLYEEQSPTIAYSEPITGDTDWREYSVDFAATGVRHKVLLEQEGAGQSWFDNVRLQALCDPVAGEAPRVAFHSQDHGSRPVRAIDLWTLTESRPGVIWPGVLALVWQDSSVSTRAMTLDPGRYRLVIHARGEGCPGDAPVFLIEGPPGVAQRVPVRPGVNDDYVVWFTLRERGDVSFRLTSVNDGACGGAGQTIDKNIFITALTLAGPAAAR